MVKESTKEISDFTRREHQRRLNYWKEHLHCDDLIEVIYDEKFSYSLAILMNLLRAGLASVEKLEVYMGKDNSRDIQKARLMNIRGMGTLKSDYVLDRLTIHKNKYQ